MAIAHHRQGGRGIAAMRIKAFGLVALFTAVMLSVTFGTLEAADPDGKIVPIPPEALLSYSPYTGNNATASCAVSGGDQLDFGCSGMVESPGDDGGANNVVLSDTLCSQTAGVQFTVGSWSGSPAKLKYGGGADVTASTLTAGEKVCFFDGPAAIQTWAEGEGLCDYSIVNDYWRGSNSSNWHNLYNTSPADPGSGYSFQFTDWNYILDYDSECTAPSQPVSLPFAPNCVITVTDYITGVGTVTTTHVVSSNLVLNPDFEASDPLFSSWPQHWRPVDVNGREINMTGFYDHQAIYANSGYDSVHDNNNEFMLSQLMQLRSPGNYLAGFSANQLSDVQLYVNGFLAADPLGAPGPYVITTYTTYSGTTGATGGGGGYLWLYFADTTVDDTHVDDVFLYPVDGDGNLACEAQYYLDEDDTVTPGCVPDPDTGECYPVINTSSTSDSCFDCIQPSSTDQLYVSYWVAWLGCLLHNLFMCHLRIWLLVLGNWTLGVIRYLSAFFDYIPSTWSVVTTWAYNTVQDGVDWFAEEIMILLLDAMAGIAGGGTGTNFWDLLIALIDLIKDLIGAVSDMMLGLFNLFYGILTAIRISFATAPAYIEIEGVTSPNAAQLAAPGPNVDKMVYMLFAGFNLADTYLFGSSYVQLAVTISLAAMSFTAFLWSMRYLKRFVSF